MGVTPESTVATFSNGVVIPEYVYICFQMTFACITPALIVGGFAERMKFSALMLFVALWVTFVYSPIAHMVWYWAGPDAIAEAAKEVAAAAGPAKAEAEKALAAVQADSGLIFQWGAIDFAGGTVVHINSGIAALVGALMLGKRVGFRQEPMTPHSLTLTCVGAALLWVGWFGFNAGSALESGAGAGLAMMNTFVATAAAGLSWMIVRVGCSSGRCRCSASSRAWLPAWLRSRRLQASSARWVRRSWARWRASSACSSAPPIKWLFGYDDSLDVFGIHCVGGIVGALGTGLLVSPEYGGTGILDYVVKPGTAEVAEYVRDAQLIAQAKAVGADAAVVRHRLGDHLQGRRHAHRRPRPSGSRADRASTCRSTASAATSTSTECAEHSGGMALSPLDALPPNANARGATAAGIRPFGNQDLATSSRRSGPPAPSAGTSAARSCAAPWRCLTALATAASGGTIGTSPTPRTPCGCLSFGTSIMTASIIGRSQATGMR